MDKHRYIKSEKVTYDKAVILFLSVASADVWNSITQYK